MEQLTRLKINKYRHIKPGTELHFNGGFNVLLGKNGTGKTTLLDLISVVISGDFSPLRGDEALDFFDLIVGQRSKRLQHYPDIFVRLQKSEQSLQVATSPGFHPKDLADSIRTNLSEKNHLTTCELTETDVGFLGKFVKQIGASLGWVTVSLRDKPADEVVYDFQITRFAFEFPDGRYVTHETLSYGQKRLLAFLYYLAANENIKQFESKVRNPIEQAHEKFRANK